MIEQTKSRPQQTLEFKMSKQMQTFSPNPPINLIGEDKRLLAVTSSAATNSVFNITNENKNVSISTRGHWTSEDGEEFITELKNVLELRSENDIELHVESVIKRGNQIKIGDNEHIRLSDFDSREDWINKE